MIDEHAGASGEPADVDVLAESRTVAATDESIETGGADRPTRARRVLRSAVAAAAIVGLAGCATSDEVSDEEGPDDSPGPGPDAPDDGTTVDGTNDDGEFELTGNCPSGQASRADLELVHDEIRRVETDIEMIQWEWAELAGRRAQLPGGMDAATIETARDVGLTVRESVVFLDMGAAHATGWFVDPNHVLTNSHNVLGMSSVDAWTVDGDRVSLQVVDAVEDMAPDVALLRTSYDGTPLPVGTSASVEPGDPLVQVGHPGDVGRWLISLGVHIRTDDPDVGETPDGFEIPINMTTSVPGMEGVSGSPLVDLSGEVVGMTHGGTDQEQRLHGEPPQPAEPVVHDWPFPVKSWAQHVPIEDAMALYEEWR